MRKRCSRASASFYWEAKVWESPLSWAHTWHSEVGHLPLLPGLITSRVDTWAFPESTACSPRRTICRTCMHHWHSKIKIFPLPRTQQPSPHPPALQLGITWRPNMNPRMEISQLEPELNGKEHTFRTRGNYRMATGMVSVLRLPESKFISAHCYLHDYGQAPSVPQCPHLGSGGKNSIYVTGWLGEWMMMWKCSAQPDK